MPSVHPDYVPPPLPGYVWFSNFFRNIETRELYTEITTAQQTAKALNVPELDVFVTPFREGFAAYVKMAHQAKVAWFLKRLELTFAEVQRLARVYNR
jgi:hypothetical protein